MLYALMIILAVVTTLVVVRDVRAARRLAAANETLMWYIRTDHIARMLHEKEGGDR